MPSPSRRRSCSSTSRPPASTTRSRWSSCASCKGIRDRVGCGVLLIDHDLHFVMALCERMYVLDAGRVIAAGTPAEVQGRPARRRGLPRHAALGAGGGWRRVSAPLSPHPDLLWQNPAISRLGRDRTTIRRIDSNRGSTMKVHKHLLSIVVIAALAVPRPRPSRSAAAAATRRAATPAVRRTRS